MIYMENLSKSFDRIKAVNRVTLRVENGDVFGLLGTNGAGKSTLLRLMAGILRAEEGEIYFDGEPVYDREPVKRRIFYLSDDQYYFPGATPDSMGEYYRNLYAGFDTESYRGLLEQFGLDGHRKLRTFSKGMKRQAGICAGICAGTDYLLCDEAFDGLDPLVRKAVKEALLAAVKGRGLTAVIASHNLEELESICSRIGILYRGGVLLEKKVEGESLQEIFERETEAAGYDVKALLS